MPEAGALQFLDELFAVGRRLFDELDRLDVDALVADVAEADQRPLRDARRHLRVAHDVDVVEEDVVPDRVLLLDGILRRVLDQVELLEVRPARAEERVGDVERIKPRL